MVVTPGSDKKAGKKAGTPQSAKSTPKGVGMPRTPKGEAATPSSAKAAKGTPQQQLASSATPPSLKKSGQKQQKAVTLPTPDSAAKSVTPQSGKTVTPQSQKGPKPDTPHPRKAITPKSQKLLKQQKVDGDKRKSDVSVKKRKHDADESDSAEEDFEALLRHPGKNAKKDEASSAKKVKTSESPVKSPIGALKLTSPGAKSPSGTPAGKPTPDQSKKHSAGKKRSLEESSDDEDEDGDDASDDDDDAAGKVVMTKEKVPDAKLSKKMKLSAAKQPAVSTPGRLNDGAVGGKSGALTDADVQKDRKRQDDLEKRLLFITKIPDNITETQIKSLHPSIINVQLSHLKWKHHQNKHCLAHLEFANEKSADDAFKALSKRKFGSQPLVVDYYGVKSRNPAKSKLVTVDQLDACKLFVRHIPRETTTDELKTLFPTADKVSLITRQDGQNLGFGFVQYSNAAACKKAHDAAEKLTIKSHSLVVVYAKKSNGGKKDDKTAKTSNQEVSAVLTKTKLESVQGSKKQTVAAGQNNKLQQQVAAASTAAKTSNKKLTTAGPGKTTGVEKAGKRKSALEEDDDDDDVSDDDDDDEDDDESDVESDESDMDKNHDDSDE